MGKTDLGTSDLTILYITASEMPERWMKFQLEHLRIAIGDAPIISVSRRPMDLGVNLIDTEPKSYWNIYMQMLRAAEIAKTPFVAMAEDDTLYTHEHFCEFRPPMNEVSYDRSRWSLFTWEPMYSVRQRISNCSLIAPTQLLIEALSERKRKWVGRPVPSNDMVGEIGKRAVESKLGTSNRKSVEWYCGNPIVQLNHPEGTDNGDYGMQVGGKHNGRHMIKKHGQIKAYDIPYWGKATDIVKVYSA